MKALLIAAALAAQSSVALSADLVVDAKGRIHGTGLVKHETSAGAIFEAPPPGDVPPEYDLRALGFVSPIKDQGGCGSCWAHAIVESLEDAILRSGGQQTILAPQQMVSCDDNAAGCGGGNMDDANYIVDPGVTLEAKYPYKASDERCKKPLPAIAAKADSYTYVGEKGRAPTTLQLQQAIYAHGSLFVTVAAGGGDWDGRDTMRDCGNGGTNHMVEIVGWKKDPQGQTGDILWIMRNSWGTNWGDKGFAYMPPGCDNIASDSESAAYVTYTQAR